jgi:phytoene dehydrogenase-like protein
VTASGHGRGGSGGGWSRRDLLTAFLGAPLAHAACRTHGAGGRERGLPPGELVGPSVDAGHRIRDRIKLEPGADDWADVPVVIIGAGVAGLSAAWWLQRAGRRDFAVLELETTPGGTSRSGDSPIVKYPWGAHYIPAPLKEDVHLVALLDEMGVLEGRDARGNPLVAEQFLCRDPEERIFFRGRWYEGLYLRAGASPEDLRQLGAFTTETERWVAWRDARGRRAFALPVASCSYDAEVTALDRFSMAEWMDARGLTSPRLRWLVDYACRDDYGSTLNQTSAWAALFYFCARVGEAGAESQPLVTWPEGNGRLVAHLHDAVADRVRLGVAAVDVRTLGGDGDARLEVIGWDRARERPVGYRTRRVIFAAPRFLAPYLIADYPSDARAVATEFHYNSWVVANLWLSDRPAEARGSFPPCWDNVLYESPSLGYVVATHQTEASRGPTVFTYYYPLCEADSREGRSRLLSAGRDEWAEVALSDLERAHPGIRALADRVDIVRWGHAMVTPRPGFIWGAARQRAAEPFRNIHFAHTDLSGIALLEEALHHGVRAAEEVAALLPRAAGRVRAAEVRG